MPTPKKTPAKKTSPKSFKVTFSRPGFAPEELKVKAGQTVQEFLNDNNVTADDLKSLQVSVNSQSASLTSELAKDDVIRIAPKTKNG